MGKVVKAAAAGRVHEPWAGAVLAQRAMEGCQRGHRAAPWSASRGVRCPACLPCGFQGRFAECLHHPGLSGRDAQGAWRAVVCGDRHPAARVRRVPLQAQALVKQFPAGCWGVGHHASAACGGFALGFLGKTSEGQERVGRGANPQFLAVCDRPPCGVRGGAIETPLPPSYLPFHGVPIAVCPRGLGGGCGPFDARVHRLPSPKRRTLCAVKAA